MPTTHLCQGVLEQILLVSLMFGARDVLRLPGVQVHYAVKMGGLKLGHLYHLSQPYT